MPRAKKVAEPHPEPEPVCGGGDPRPGGGITLSAQQLSTLLHEMRNPLTALSTLAKLLQKRLPPDDRNHWIGLSIEQECRHLQDLLAELERLDGIPAPLHLRPLALADLLREWIPIYQALAEAQGHRFQAVLPPSLPPVQADPRALRQVLDNLIDNACKYTPPPGDIQLRVEVKLTEEARGSSASSRQEVWIAVCDNGPGIHPENLERIFDPFFRADLTKPGQGLGLAISRDLATQMGGDLQVESSPQGSCFRLRLPTAQ
ncbi:sensor histidine kinase [Synechococcus sp. B60.1]|uniref:sensor histidine kinase n=1 Tax=unclassified Synechococcus TaxID=2626047 RepID=UPI0039C16C22